MTELTQERLKELLEYNPFTGLFTWLSAKGSKTAGSLAGAVNTKGYVRIRLDNKTYLAHRLVWLYLYGRWPVEQLDHINGIRADNRRVNLRECNQSQNMANSRGHLKAIVAYKGVYKNRQNSYRAELIHEGKRYNLGCYLTPEEAKHAYDLKAKELQGEFFKDERTV